MNEKAELLESLLDDTRMIFDVRDVGEEGSRGFSSHTGRRIYFLS